MADEDRPRCEREASALEFVNSSSAKNEFTDPSDWRCVPDGSFFCKPCLEYYIRNGVLMLDPAYYEYVIVRR